MGELESQARILKDWAIHAALPFWAKTGIDKRGGFYEELDLDGRPNVNAIRRVRVQARQIYVYAQATHLGWYDGQSLANVTFDFMCEIGHEINGERGFIHRIKPNYSPQDIKRDFYDHAFYLLGCASLLKLGPHPKALEILQNIATLLESWESPHGGWVEGSPARLPRRQNPHMHFLEASMALYAATGHSHHLENARKVIDLFDRKFFDPKHHIIREFFTDDWQYMDGPIGETSEPGHAAEWVWLLSEYQKLSDQDMSAFISALYDSLKQPGIFLNDEEDIYGTIRRGTKRLWVQTELVKAHIAQIERGYAPARSDALRAIKALKDTYLNDNGTWVDQIDPQGQACAVTIPTSTFYHIFCMIAELCRVLDI